MPDRKYKVIIIKILIRSKESVEYMTRPLRHTDKEKYSRDKRINK